MSVQATSWVIQNSKHKGSPLLLLIMIANHAHADGTGAFPSVGTLARECRISPRQVKRILPELEASGELIIDRSRGRMSHHYAIRMSVNSDKMSLLENGHSVKPNSDISGKNGNSNSDKMSRLTVTSANGNGDKSGTSTVTPRVNAFKEESLTNKDLNRKQNGRSRNAAPDPRAKHPAILAVREIGNIWPNRELWDEIIQVLGADPDTDKLRTLFREWVKRGFNPVNYNWALDWYANGMTKNGNGHRGPPIDPSAPCEHCKNERRIRGAVETYPCDHCRPAEAAKYWKSRGK
jgi:hypothetical protein